MDPRSESFSAAASDGESDTLLHTLAWGEPGLPRLVLLHGGGANAHWWDHLAPHWADRFHVVALDFRGHGDSERPEELVPGAFGRDLEALLGHLDERGPERDIVLAGHSMGAQIALEHVAAAGARGNVRALVLIDPSRGGAARRKRRLRLALTFRRTYASREEAIDRYRFLPPAEHASETLRAAIASASVEQEADGRWGYKFDPRWFGLPGRKAPEAERITCPTLVIRGAESGVLTEAGALELCNEIPGSQLALIERAGHHVQIDQPEAVLRALDGFFDALPPA